MCCISSWFFDIGKPVYSRRSTRLSHFVVDLLVEDCNGNGFNACEVSLLPQHHPKDQITPDLRLFRPLGKEVLRCLESRATLSSALVHSTGMISILRRGSALVVGSFQVNNASRQWISQVSTSIEKQPRQIRAYGCIFVPG